MSTVAVLQARVSSSRLPGKVLLPILDKPMLEHEIQRVQSSKKLGKLVVATSTNEEDDAIESLCKQLGVACFRGDLNNVLSRFYHAALPFSPEHVVRLTGDCPVIDPDIIDSVVSFHMWGGYDYTSNTINPTFPDGLDVEIMKFSVLKEAFEQAKLPFQLEHVTPYIYQHSEKYRLGSYEGNVDLSALRWTVDELEDFDFIRWVYKELYPINPFFKLTDIHALLEKHPNATAINAKFKRNEGLQKSLQAKKMDTKGS